MAWLSKNSFSPTDSLHADDVNNLANDIRVWGGNVNGGGYHLTNVIIDAYYPGTGVGLLSPIHVIPTSTDYSSSVHLDSEAAGNPARWILIKDQSTESGSNAGSNFFLERCDDTGNVIDSPIAINRASGIITMGAQQWSGNVNGGGFTLTNVVIPSVFNDPTTTLGDMIVRGSSGIARIAVGADGMMLTADHTQPLGVKWAISPAVMPTRQVIAGTGLGGGGPLSSDVTLTANVVTVFGRTGAVVLTAADITGATGVIGTRQVLAGAGMTGGGPLSADVTLNAAVTSVFGRTGAVTLQASDISTAGGVPATRQVIAGQGMSGGGNLGADITLNALVTSVFGRTGAVTLTAADVAAGGGVPAIRKIIPGTGITTTGNANSDLSTDLTIAVTNDTSIQRVNWASGAGSIVGTRSTLNFIQGQNITIGLADNSAANRMDVTINSSGLTQVWVESLGTKGTPALIGTRAGINFISGTNVTISGVDNPTQNTVDLTFSAVGGTGSGTSQTPWLGPIDAAGETLSNVAQLGVNSVVDPTGIRVNVITTAGEAGVRVTNSQTTTYGTVEVDNDNATAKISLRAYGSQYGGTLQSTAGLSTGPTAPMTFSINNSEAMRISTGKRILIGTSADDGTHILQVNGAIKSLAGGIVFPDGTTQLTAISSSGLQDPTTTLGDLIVRGSTAPARLGVGADGQVLVSNSTASNGLGVNWAAPPSAFWVAGTGGAIYYSAGSVGVGRNPIVLGSPWTNTLEVYAHGSIPAIVLTGDWATAAMNVQFQGRSYSGANQNSGTGYLGLAARGTEGSPTAVTLGDQLVALTGEGHDGSAFAVGGTVVFKVGSAWTPSSHETFFSITTAPAGSTVLAERMRVTGAGLVGIGTASPAVLLDCAGGIRSLGGPNPTVGAGLELNYVSGNASFVLSYDRGAGTYLPLKVQGTVITLNGSTSTILQPAGGNVGIGTASPAALLNVNGETLIGAVSTAPYSLLDVTDGAGHRVQVGPMGWALAGSAGFTFTNDSNTAIPAVYWASLHYFNGNVGIGTTSPSARLNVAGTSTDPSLTADTEVVYFGYSSSIGLAFGSYPGDPSYAAWIQTKRTTNSGSADQLAINPLGGNVGIGTASPSTMLSLGSGTIQAIRLAIYDNGPSTVYGIGVVSGGLAFGSNIPYNGTPQMVVMNSGNVGIGTTSPSATLHVVGTAKHGTSAYAATTGDLGVSRDGSPTTGAVYFGNSPNVYIYYNGSAWQINPALPTIGAWTAYTPTINDGSVTITPSNIGASYVIAGTVLFVSIGMTFTATGKTVYNISLPTTVFSQYQNQGVSCQIDSSGAPVANVSWATSTQIVVSATLGAGTYNLRVFATLRIS